MSCGAFGMPSILSATFPSLNSMIVGSASTLYFDAMLGYFSVFIFCAGGRRRVVLACEAVFARETCWELFCRLFVFWVSDERGGGGGKGGKGGGGGGRRQKTASTGTHHQLHPVLAHCPRDFGQDVAREHLARAAPRGVEVHEHGHGRSLDHVVERRVRFLRRVSHARIPATRRIVRYFQSAGCGHGGGAGSPPAVRGAHGRARDD